MRFVRRHRRPLAASLVALAVALCPPLPAGAATRATTCGSSPAAAAPEVDERDCCPDSPAPADCCVVDPRDPEPAAAGSSGSRPGAARGVESAGARPSPPPLHASLGIATVRRARAPAVPLYRLHLALLI